jgi:hypothetical protein
LCCLAQGSKHRPHIGRLRGGDGGVRVAHLSTCDVATFYNLLTQRKKNEGEDKVRKGNLIVKNRTEDNVLI